MSEYEQRLAAFERRLREMQTELAELRKAAPAATAAAAPPAKADPWQTTAAAAMKDLYATEPVVTEPVAPAPPPSFAWPPPASPSPPSPPPPVMPPLPPRESRVRREREPLDLSKLLGARTLAMTGGIVSLLGIVFFFALAVQRSWIGPVARVSLGAVASGLMLAAGWWLRRRFGETFASTAAAGAGIAGAYATLLAAAARYDLVSEPVALVLAALIAAAATATALAWSDQGLAGLGLVGAILAPLAVAVRDEQLATAGVAFAALMLAASIVVSLRRDWDKLLVVASVCAGFQVVLVLLDAEGRTGEVLALSIVFWALFLGTGIVEAIRRERLTRLAGSFVIAGSAFSGYAAAMLFEDRALGVALLASALANGAVAAVVFRRARDLGSLLWATALALAALGTAQLVSDATLTMAWAVEAAVLAWLAERLREPRFRLAALAWLGLALTHSLIADAPVSKLFEQTEHPASGVPSLLALAAAALLAGRLRAEFDAEPGKGLAADLVNGMGVVRRETRLALDALAGLLLIEAASLTLLELVPSWNWGHVAVTGLWGAIAVGLMLAGQRLPGLAWAVATVLLAVVYDVDSLSGDARWSSLAIAAATSVIAALLFERELGPVSGTGVVAGAGLAVAAGLGVAGHDLQWLLVLAVGAGYLVLGAAFLRARRDQSTLLWSLGLALAVAASGQLLEGFWLVLALSAAAAAAAFLAPFEERLDPAALVLLGLALAATIAVEATPGDLFVAQRHPGAGVPAALAVVAGAAVYAWLRRLQRPAVIWTAAVLSVFAASLAILELFELLGGSVDTDFQRGHTAVSAVWGLIGLALLYAGLVRRSTALQLAGFALFGVSLVKLFLYDLAFLSSVARALSFLAVGALLIAGGFFYQRLAAAPEPDRL